MLSPDEKMSSIFTWPETAHTVLYIFVECGHGASKKLAALELKLTAGSLLNALFTYRLQFLFIFSFMSICTFTRNPGMDTSWIHSVANTKLSFMSVIQLLSIKRHVAFFASPSHFPRLKYVTAFKTSYPADSCEERKVSP